MYKDEGMGLRAIGICACGNVYYRNILTGNIITECDCIEESLNYRVATLKDALPSHPYWTQSHSVFIP